MENRKNLDITTSLIAQLKSSGSAVVMSLLDSIDHIEPIPGIIRQINDIDISNDTAAERFSNLNEQLYSQLLDAHNATTHLAPDLIDLSRDDALKFHETVMETVLDVILISGPNSKTRDVHDLLSEAQDFLMGYDEAPIRQVEIQAAKIGRLAQRMRS